MQRSLHPGAGHGDLSEHANLHLVGLLREAETLQRLFCCFLPDVRPRRLLRHDLPERQTVRVGNVLCCASLVLANRSAPTVVARTPRTGAPPDGEVARVADCCHRARARPQRDVMRGLQRPLQPDDRRLPACARCSSQEARPWLPPGSEESGSLSGLVGIGSRLDCSPRRMADTVCR